MIAALSVAALSVAAASAPSACAYDRAAMLRLGEDAFDQDLSGGWRALADRGCELAAADLIHDWREAKGAAVRRPSVLSWHEGQLRADAGQTRQAIALFKRSRKSPAADAGLGWNDYVDGTIAFLHRDRGAFDAAYSRLAALPEPAGLDPRGPDGKPITIAWPMNLDVLDGFRRCWERPYKAAYGPGCRVPRHGRAYRGAAVTGARPPTAKLD